MSLLLFYDFSAKQEIYFEMDISQHYKNCQKDQIQLNQFIYSISLRPSFSLQVKQSEKSTLWSFREEYQILFRMPTGHKKMHSSFFAQMEIILDCFKK